MPEAAITPQQHGAFTSPSTYEELETSLLLPIKDFMDAVPPFPEEAVSPHPFKGGETVALQRLNHLIASGVMTNYKDTRNGLIGPDFSTKLSAYLAQGCVTARQVHEAMLGYENGTLDEFKDVEGYGKGENEGTKAVRFELLWRDYMRLCTKKFKHRLFRQEGFRDGEHGKKAVWKSALPAEAAPNQTPNPRDIAKIIERFNGGTTGMGLIDASQRELIHTGYTSNRARQNVASFLAKHLGIDWRYGAEWYEMLLIDYDVNSNWANWQYVAGVGNDPRGEARIFNPVKQAFDYDKEGKYVRMWVPEVRRLDKLENVFQAWTSSPEDLETAGLTGSNMVTDPVKRIDFSVAGKPRTSRRPFIRRVRGNGGRYQNGNGHGDVQNDGSDGQSGSPTSPRQSGFGGSPPSFDAPRGPRARGGARGGRGNGVRGDWGYNSGRGNSYGIGYNNGFRAGFRAGFPAVAPGMGPMPVRATWSVGGQPIG
jgi:deoxyribodipyrimidine photo-lyase